MSSAIKESNTNIYMFIDTPYSNNMGTAPTRSATPYAGSENREHRFVFKKRKDEKRKQREGI
jgi:hypothetical protein